MPDWHLIARPQRDILGEGLLWSPRSQCLYWTDILGLKLWQMRLADGAITGHEMPGRIGWVVERASGGLMAGIDRRLCRLDPATMQPETLAELEPELPGNRLNDAKADAQGRIWAGTMDAACEAPTGSLYRLDPDGTVTRYDTGITIANGPALSPDGAILYHTDTRQRIVWRFALHADGTLGPRRVHLQFARGDNPDGMCCDSQGHLWIAFYGAGCVRRFTPDGQPDRQIDLPTPQLTNVCFAGPNLDRMFVTSAADGRQDDALAGALFEVDTGGVTGLAPHLFAG